MSNECNHALKIFLSSTLRDLKSVRKEIASKLKEVFDVAAMETVPADVEESQKSMLKELEKCDAVVLLIGEIFGIEDGKVSYTRCEYRYARRFKQTHLCL